MKLRTMLGLAAIGGVAYAHKQRGGTFTLESLKETARALADGFFDEAKRAMTPPGARPRDTTGRTSTYADARPRIVDDDNLH